MIFTECAERHGIEFAKRWFYLSDSLVFTVHVGKYVFAQCGRWKASEPLAIGQSVEEAKNKLRAAILYSHKTEETIYGP